MHKNLLYLYNDGHNPFPHLGKGGLGYKLPKRKRGRGLEFRQDGTMMFVPDLNMTSEQAANANLELWNAERELPPVENIPDEETPGYTFLDDDDEIDERNEKEIQKHEMITMLESMGVNTDKYYSKIDEDKIARNEDAFERDLFEKGIMIINDLDSKLDSNTYTEQDQNKMINAQKQIAINNYSKLIQKSKQNYAIKSTSIDKDTGGKAFEEFLQTYGQSIIKTLTNNKSNVQSSDDNPLNPYDDLKLIATIDLYNRNTLIECKDYKNISADSDKVVLQDTKLCGDHNYNLVFNSEGKIIHFQVKNPMNKKDKTDILTPVTEGRDYIVIYRLDDGLYEYNVSESIKKIYSTRSK
eukprot:GHVU01222359.1.p1 GENE.GHVU01222359.1~~GHVU01222359.1.p1  ORF type:complete len:354 (+),score=58.59 GHVU01222359.1:1873-2934(+)